MEKKESVTGPRQKFGQESKDVTQKNLEAFPDVAADLLNAFIYEGKQVIQADALLPAPTETTYAAPGCVLRSQLEDISKYELRKGRIRVQYLLSNQTTRDPGMILRKAGYVGAAYREQYDGKTPGRFPVVNLLLYWGTGHWKRGLTIKRFFGKSRLPRQLWKLTDNLRLHVFEMRNLPPQVRERFHSDMRLVVDYLAEGDAFRSHRPVVHKEALIRLLRSLGGDQDVEDTALILNEMNLKEEDEITMCELFDQYTRRGMQEGLKKGRQEGRQKGIREGRQEGLQALASLNTILLSGNRIDDLKRASEDADYRNQLFAEYGLLAVSGE